ncbi:MAG: hypothetical protein GY679_04705 [Mycoplasma sp.]|nr:hypothetical protein [Mycoplasma sp.]
MNKKINNKTDSYIKIKIKYYNKKYKIPVVLTGILGAAVISSSIALPLKFLNKKNSNKKNPKKSTNISVTKKSPQKLYFI